MNTMSNGSFLNPVPIQNVTVQEVLKNCELYAYRVTPEEGYALHNKTLDVEIIDPDTYEGTGEFVPGFLNEMCTVKSDYDFNNTKKGTYTYTDENGEEKTIEVLKVGHQELYTIPKELILKEQPIGGRL